MKTVADTCLENERIRFVAVSASIPNAEDIAEWIGAHTKLFRFPDELRPVPLKKIVLGYHYNPKMTMFKFDLSLNYKLRSLIFRYSESKPTMVRVYVFFHFGSNFCGKCQTINYIFVKIGINI